MVVVVWPRCQTPAIDSRATAGHCYREDIGSMWEHNRRKVRPSAGTGTSAVSYALAIEIPPLPCSEGRRTGV